MVPNQINDLRHILTCFIHNSANHWRISKNQVQFYHMSEVKLQNCDCTVHASTSQVLPKCVPHAHRKLQVMLWNKPTACPFSVSILILVTFSYILSILNRVRLSWAELCYESLPLYVKDASEETQGQDLPHVFKGLIILCSWFIGTHTKSPPL